MDDFAEAKFSEWEECDVEIAYGEDYTWDAEGFDEAPLTGEPVDAGTVLTVVSRDWDQGWIYNLRDADGRRVWNVKEEDLEEN